MSPQNHITPSGFCVSCSEHSRIMSPLRGSESRGLANPAQYTPLRGWYLHWVVISGIITPIRGFDGLWSGYASRISKNN